MNNTTQTTEPKKRGRKPGVTNAPVTIRIPLHILTANNTGNHLVSVERKYLMNMLGITEEQLEALAAQFKPAHELPTGVTPEFTVPDPVVRESDKLESEEDEDPEEVTEEPEEVMPIVTRLPELDD